MYFVLYIVSKAVLGRLAFVSLNTRDVKYDAQSRFRQKKKNCPKY